MNKEVVDDTLQNLDTFSPKKKTAPQFSQRRPVLGEEDFRDLSKVAPQLSDDVKDCDPTEEDLNLDLYEGLSDKAMMKVPTKLDPVLEDLKSSQRWDVENLGLRKGKKRLHWSLEAVLDLGTALIPLKYNL